ncbi:MAG: hypothetical protein H7A09_05155 [Oceanospirillaceae bacterium]|nr:hypothetical protein [Oceanospirillaceae bacterium]
MVAFAGCSVLPGKGSAQAPQGDESFYTWVDDKGQLHSEPRKKKTPQITASSEKGDGKSDINPADYTPVEVVDARLAQKRLYAWTDDQGLNHVEEKDKPKPEDAPVPVVSSVVESENPFPATCCITLSLQNKLLLSELKTRSLSLEDYYHSDESFSHGAVVVDIDMPSPALRVQSFIRNNRVAVPDILLLDERYRVVHYFEAPLSHYVSESWFKFGYLQGLIGSEFLDGVRYLVITPGSKAGVLPLDENEVKITDFGFVTVFPDAPAL